MASDGARLLDASDPQRLNAIPSAAQIAARPKGPAKPILKGVGLDAPFFDDKNRAFWVLQSIGWGGYFLLRSLSGLANSMGAMFIVHALLLTATGYSLTLLMASLFRRLITIKVLWTLILSFATVTIAAGTFSAIETWSYATFLKPDYKPVGLEYLGALLLDFVLLIAWSALYYGINYYLLLEEEIDQRAHLESAASTRADRGVEAGLRRRPPSATTPLLRGGFRSSSATRAAARRPRK